MKKCFIAIAPENGWDNVVGIYLAKNKEQVWKKLASYNVGDTVEQLKKEKYYIIHERQLEEI